MEAPKVIHHFENLDAQHDQPGLQAPVYHDSHGFDDDDIEDDGQALPQEDYENNKVWTKFFFCKAPKKGVSGIMLFVSWNEVILI